MENEKNKNIKYLKWLIAIVAILVIVVPIIMNFDKWMHFLSNPNKIKQLILSYGSYSIFVFIFLQIMQIVIFFIPGEVVQFAGGYIFGPYLSFVLCIIGIVIGSAITFSISRKFGKPFVEKIVSKDSLWIIRKIEAAKHHREEKHPHKARKKHPKTIIFILYMIPGIPKDILGYISGIADMSLKEFLIISTIARSPALFISCFFGNKIVKIKDYFTGEYMWFWIGGTIVALIIVIIVLYYSRRFVNKLKEDVEGA
ncbi:MAG: TVP38/TMEM64 family protein [Sarcina sp.]